MNSPFKDTVISVVSSVPKGKVVSYGQVAAYAGVPRAAREVGWIMNELGGEVPWWRVLNNKGYISIRGNATADKELQKKLLEAEGIEVSENFELDMKKYRYSPDPKILEGYGNSDDYINTLIAKYNL